MKFNTLALALATAGNLAMSNPLGSEGDPALERALRTKTEETLVAPHSAAFMFDVLNEFFRADRNDISEVAPYKRGFGMVFQSLALFSHMSVAQNSAYGLKLRKASALEQRERVK